MDLTTIGLGLSCLAIGIAAIGEGIAVAKTMEAIGRNPSCAKDARMNMIIGVGLIESCAIYVLVIALLIAFVLGK